jgi:hypothetical protein
VRFQRVAWTLSLFLSLCFLLAISSRAQTQNQKPNPRVPPPNGLPAPGGPTISTGSGDVNRERMEREMAKKANLARQAGIRADTDKLLKLAVELKDYVDKSNENVLSLDVLKKADEIEKLAHSVKDKMKGPS